MDYKDVLLRTAGRIFEEAAFALVDPPEEDVDRNLALMIVEVDFNGHFSGKTAMAADARIATIMAANMLGVDEDDPSVGDKGLDAMKELLNMICGNMLPAIAGTRAEFKIEAPVELDSAGFFEMYDKTASMNCTSARLFVEGFDTLLTFCKSED